MLAWDLLTWTSGILIPWGPLGSLCVCKSMCTCVCVCAASMRRRDGETWLTDPVVLISKQPYTCRIDCLMMHIHISCWYLLFIGRVIWWEVKLFNYRMHCSALVRGPPQIISWTSYASIQTLSPQILHIAGCSKEMIVSWLYSASQNPLPRYKWIPQITSTISFGTILILE